MSIPQRIDFKEDLQELFELHQGTDVFEDLIDKLIKRRKITRLQAIHTIYWEMCGMQFKEDED